MALYLDPMMAYHLDYHYADDLVLQKAFDDETADGAFDGTLTRS